MTDIKSLVDQGLIVLPTPRAVTPRAVQTIFDQDELDRAKGGKRENVRCSMCLQQFTVSVGAKFGKLREDWVCVRCAGRLVSSGS